MSSSPSSFALTLLRVVAGLLLLQHGLIKLIGFPPGAPPGQIPFDLNAITTWTHPGQLFVGAVIETVAGILVTVGLFTRVAAFFAAGLTAVAFWQFHFLERGQIIYPAVNGGETVVLFCFIFFYILFAGPGALALDNLGGKK
jgi:putative oxidoreductase